MLKEKSTKLTFEERFIVRPPEMSDMEDVLELLQICDIHQSGEIETSIDVLKTDWTLPTVEMERNFRIVTTQNGRVIAFAEMWDTDDPLVITWNWARVHPDFEGQGIGTHLLKWAEQSSRKAMARAPKEARFIMQAGTLSTYQPAHDLFQDQGFKLLRHFLNMEIDLTDMPPAPHLPENIVIRPMQGIEEIPPVVQAVEDAFQDHFGYIEQDFDKQVAHWTHIAQTDSNFDQTLWFLAMDGDQIAGMSLCWPNRGARKDVGWVGTLGVLRPWRRQGLGLSLLNHSFRELRQRGKSKAGLGVDADSLTGATLLYEKAGMHPTRQFDIYEKVLRPGVDMMLKQLE